MYDYTNGDRVLSAPEKPKPEESLAMAATKAGERFIEACRKARVSPKAMLATLLCRTG